MMRMSVLEAEFEKLKKELEGMKTNGSCGGGSVCGASSLGDIASAMGESTRGRYAEYHLPLNKRRTLIVGGFRRGLPPRGPGRHMV